MWRDYDFTVVAFDLTDGRKAFESALTLVCDALGATSHVGHICMAGIKRDLIPDSAYDTAVLLRQPAIDAAYYECGLKVYPVSSITGEGFLELSKHIGEFPAFTSPAMLIVVDNSKHTTISSWKI